MSHFEKLSFVVEVTFKADSKSDSFTYCQFLKKHHFLARRYSSFKSFTLNCGFHLSTRFYNNLKFARQMFFYKKKKTAQN